MAVCGRRCFSNLLVLSAIDSPIHYALEVSAIQQIADYDLLEVKLFGTWANAASFRTSRWKGKGCAF